MRFVGVIVSTTGCTLTVSVPSLDSGGGRRKGYFISQFRKPATRPTTVHTSAIYISICNTKEHNTIHFTPTVAQGIKSSQMKPI